MPIPTFGQKGVKQNPTTEITTMIERLRNMTPEQRRAVIEGAGEMIGGIGGAIAGGGVMSIPGAGAGAVAGKNIASFVADAAGLPKQERTAGEEAWEQAKTAGLNMAGEGAGRLAPAVAKVARRPITAAKDAVRSFFQPDALTARLNAMADRYGIPLTLANRSGKSWVASMQASLDRSPVTEGMMQDAYAKQMKAFEGMLNRLSDRLYKGKISEAQFANTAERSIRNLASKFNKRVAEGAESAAKQFYPSPVSQVEAGQALKAGRQANLDVVSKWADKAYGSLREKYGNYGVNLESLGSSAKALLDEFPDESLRKNIFSGDAMRKLESAVKGSSEVIGQIDEAGGIVDATVPKTIPLSEALELRSRILRIARNLKPDVPSEQKRAVYALADGINESVEKSLADAPEALKEVKRLNSTYKQKMQALNPPAVAGKPGNPSAQQIRDENVPERIPPSVTSSPTLTKGAMQAASPATVADIGKSAVTDAVPKLQRNVLDETLSRATITDAATGVSRVSPTAFASKVPKVAPDLYGRRLGSVEGIGSQRLAQAEETLYDNPFTRASARGERADVVGQAFPANAPRESQVSLDLLRQAGGDVEAQGRRAYIDSLANVSRAQSKVLPGESILSPERLRERLRLEGETAPTVMGAGLKRRFDDALDLGVRLTESERRNPSGTAKTLEALKLAGQVGGAVYGLGTGDVGSALALIAGGFAVPKVAAKALTSDRLARTLTAPTSGLFKNPFGGPVSGAIGRAALLSMRGLPPRPQAASTQAEPPADLFENEPPESLFEQ